MRTPPPVPLRLTGISASRATIIGAIFFATFAPLVLGGLVPLMLLQAGLNGAPRGHLPWTAVQWAVTTPSGRAPRVGRLPPHPRPTVRPTYTLAAPARGGPGP